MQQQYHTFIISIEMKVPAKFIPIVPFLIFFIISSCTKEAEREFPRVRTLEAGNITENGVVLRGEISNYQSVDIEEYGFMVTQNPSLSEDDILTISRANDPGSGTFEAPLTGGIEEGKSYLFVAYAISNGLLSVGGEMIFESMGRNPPAITGISPAEGFVGDTIEIFCSNIIGPEDKYSVSFGLTNAELVFFSDTLIKVVVPLSLETRENTVSIAGYGKKSNAQTPFTLVQPVIDSFSPTEAYPGEEVIITGMNFHPVKELNKVFFSNFSAELLNVSPTTLTVRVPQLNPGDYSIIVTVSGQSASTSNNMIRIRGQELTYFEPTSASFLEQVDLYGNALLIAGQPEVYFNEVKASIVELSNEKISVLVPVGLADPVATIKLVYAAITIEYEISFSLVEPEGLELITTEASGGQDIIIQGINLNPVPENNIIVINGVNIIPYFYDGFQLIANIGNSIPEGSYNLTITIGGSDIQVNNMLTVLPSPWTRVADFPGGEVYKSASFVIDGAGFAGTGTALGHNYVTGFWKFSPATDTWASIEDFTGPTRIMANAFSLGNQGYIGGGFDLDAPWRVALHDYYSYNPAEGWARISDFPYYADKEYNWWKETVNNTRYFSPGNNLLFSFKANPEEWNQINGTPSIKMGASSFVIDNKIYVIDEDRKVREYDPSLNQWTTKNDFPGPGRSYGVAFSYGGKGYYGLGGHSSYYNDIWMYNPLTDTWTKSAPFIGAARNLPFCFVIDNYVYIGTGYIGGNRCVSDVYKCKLD